MLEVLRRGQRWWTAAVVVFVGGVFAVFIGLGGPLRSGRGQSLIVVGDVRVGPGEFERARQQQIRYYERMLGDQFDPKRVGDQVIDGGATRMLVERAILAQEAERLGLTVAKQEVEREVLANPGFRDPHGRFDKEQFEGWVSYEFGSERNFREQQRRADLATKLLRVLHNQALVSEGEAREAVIQRLESVKLVLLVLDTSRIPEGFERDDEAVKAFEATREEELRELYDQRADEFNTPEETRARHILLRIEPGASEEEVAAVETHAQDLVKRLRAGEDFATLAKVESEDPGSKANGGDLGYFARGTMVPAFDEVAFSLEPGKISDPVRTDYGFHIIEVEDRKPAETHSFEDVEDELAFEMLGHAAGRDAAWAKARALSEQVRGGKTLEDAAREAGLTLERTDALSRRPDGFIPGLGAAQEVMAAAFVIEPGTSSDRIFEVGDKLAMVQVAEHTRPDPETIAKEVEAERVSLRQQKLNLLVETWVNQRREQLVEDGELVVNVDLSRSS